MIDAFKIYTDKHKYQNWLYIYTTLSYSSRPHFKSNLRR